MISFATRRVLRPAAVLPFFRIGSLLHLIQQGRKLRTRRRRKLRRHLARLPKSTRLPQLDGDKIALYP